MKTKIFNGTLIMLTIVLFSCSSTKMVENLGDLKKLEINKSQFIGKPLKVLLNNIKPKIEFYFGRGGWQEETGRFDFFFINHKIFSNNLEQKKPNLAVRIYVKEYFDFTPLGKTKEERFLWNKQDEEKYGNLTVSWVWVTGE